MKLIWAIMVSCVFATQAIAADVQQRNPGIEGTIGAQIDAFLEDDFATAFGYASSSIKGVFGSPERFGQMVRNGYPMVWRPGEVRFLELRNIDGALWQKVLIRDLAGRLHVLDYQMIQTDDGWRINGVQLLRPPGVGA